MLQCGGLKNYEEPSEIDGVAAQQSGFSPESRSDYKSPSLKNNPNVKRPIFTVHT